jgi:predicted nucleic acid-binding protein
MPSKPTLTDNRILECALAANAGYVVTGDNHLLKLTRFGDIQMVRPADFMRMLDRQGQRER